MDRKIKLASSVSLLALTAAACAPNPYYGGYNTGTTYNTNRTTTGTVSTQNRNAVTHTHCSRTHSHVLPPEGLAHHHGDGCLAGSGGTGSTTTTTTATNNYGSYGYTTQPAPYTPPTTTPYYDYSAGGNYNTGSNYNTGGNYNTGSNYNTGGNYNTGSNNSWGNYSGYTQPKTTTPRSNTNRSSATTNRSSSTNSNANASSYTVKQGDTVFEVMRQTGTYWKDIIRLNNLQAPYTLVPGQVLRTK